MFIPKLYSFKRQKSHGDLVLESRKGSFRSDRTMIMYEVRL